MQKIAENEFAFAFYDRSPRAPVHILVVPKKHIASLAAIESGDAASLSGVHALIKELGLRYGNTSDGGFNIVVNTGASAGQSIFHLHWHFMAGRDLYAGGDVAL